MEFTKCKPVTISDANSKYRVLFESDGLELVKDGITYTLKVPYGSGRPIFFMSKDDFKLVSYNIIVNAGMEFHNEETKEIIKLGWDHLKDHVQFATLLKDTSKEYLRKLRRDTIECIYDYFCNKHKMIGAITKDVDGVTVMSVTDGNVDLFIIEDDNYGKIRVLMDYSDSEEFMWHKPPYRAYFNELRYKSSINDLADDILQFIDDKKKYKMEAFCQDIPINSYMCKDYELQPMQEWHYEPLIIVYKNEALAIDRTELVADASIASYKFTQLVDKKHLIIPSGDITLFADDMKFVSCSDVTAEVNAVDMIIDTGETVEFYNTEYPDEKLYIPVEDLVRLREVREIIRKEFPMIVDEETKKGIRRGIKEMADIDRSLDKKGKKSLSELVWDSLQPEWKEEDLKNLSIGLALVESTEIGGIIDSYLSKNDLEGLKEFMTKVKVVKDGIYEYVKSE